MRTPPEREPTARPIARAATLATFFVGALFLGSIGDWKLVRSRPRSSRATTLSREGETLFVGTSLGVVAIDL